jgi:hypothetical protein
MNSKESGRKGLGLIKALSLYEYFPGVNEESQEKTVIVVSVPEEIRSGLLPNASPKRYL